MPYLKIKNHLIQYCLRRSIRAKRLQIRLRSEHFEIIAPKRITNNEVLRFMMEHQNWLIKHLPSQKAMTRLPNLTWPADFLAGEILPFRGSLLRLDVKFGSEESAELRNDNLTITLSWQQTCRVVAKYAKQQVITWYQQQAMGIIQATINEFCPMLDRWPVGFKLKQQKTRWGSCGIKGEIYLNWLLVLAPPGVLEYVVVHELCHLFHRDHGKHFWAKVAKCLPQYQQYEKWLNRQGGTLQMWI